MTRLTVKHVKDCMCDKDGKDPDCYRTRAQRKVDRAEKKLVKSAGKWLKEFDELVDAGKSESLGDETQKGMKLNELLGERLADLGAELMDFIRAMRDAKNES